MNIDSYVDWMGFRADDLYGAHVGRLAGVLVDEDDEARWLLVRLGRFAEEMIAVPAADAIAGNGHVWLPYEREVLRGAPRVPQDRPLGPSAVARLTDHYRPTNARAA